MAEHMRKSHNAAFKAKVAPEALKGDRTMAELSSEYGAHPKSVNGGRNLLMNCLVYFPTAGRKMIKKPRK